MSSLTAVEQFSRRHDELAGGAAPRYRGLMPFARPGPGQQYAFEVDLDACTGCKACVAACHSLNGLDPGETWRRVELVRSAHVGLPVLQTVTASCHHCADPACLKGCPADAYEKDPVTGIVWHLDDQCIGCRYCTLTCPYEVPAFNESLGIVRKCDLCRGRLEVGEAPACAQACPNGAITVTLADQPPPGPLVAGAPSSAITCPTTSYRTSRPLLKDTASVVTPAPRPAEAHPPLVVMLVLTQMAVGALTTAAVLGPLWRTAAGRVAAHLLAGLAALVGAVALGASLLHLGRPRYAYRALLGLRHSWLSREVLAFGAFQGAASAAAVMPFLPVHLPVPVAAVSGGAAVAAGWAGVACSVMLYVVTRRSGWGPVHTAVRFSTSAAVSGLGLAALCGSVVALAAAGPPPAGLGVLWAAFLAVSAVKVAGEAALPGRSAVALLGGALRPVTRFRLGAGAAGAVLAALAAVASATARPGPALLVGSLALAATTAGELLERTLFFRASGPPA